MGTIIAYAIGAIAVAVTAIQGFVILRILPKLLRVRVLSRLLEQGRIEEHRVECETLLELAKPDDLLYALVLPHYIEHLILSGRWEEAENFLTASPADSLVNLNDPRTRNLRLLYVYLLEGKMDEASRLYGTWRDRLARARPRVSALQHVRFVVAVCEYYLGDLAEAREVFRHLAGEAPPRHERAQMLYFLGCAEHQLGQVEEARVHLEKAAELGEGTFVPGAVEHFLSHQANEAVSVANETESVHVEET